MTNIITSASLYEDIRIVGTTSSPQLLLETPVAYFTGEPVVVDFAAQYLNHLPSPTTNLNGIGFDLVIDGVRKERMALAGTHAQTNDFWPITLHNVLDTPPRIIPSGNHKVGISVFKWCDIQDGYLKYNAGYQSGWGFPIRLTVSYA